MILRNLINSGWNINICQKADKNMISAVGCKSIRSNALGFCTQTKMMQSPAIDSFLPKRFFISKMCIFFRIYNLEMLYFHNIAMFIVNRQPVNFSPGSSYLTQSYRLSALMFNHMPPHGQRVSCLIRLNLPGPLYGASRETLDICWLTENNAHCWWSKDMPFPVYGNGR